MSSYGREEGVITTRSSSSRPDTFPAVPSTIPLEYIVLATSSTAWRTSVTALRVHAVVGLLAREQLGQAIGDERGVVGLRVVVAPPMWGVNTTLSMAVRGWSVGSGLLEVIEPGGGQASGLERLGERAEVVEGGPGGVEVHRALRHGRELVGPIIPVVSGAACIDTTSDSPSRSSSSWVASGEKGSAAITRIPRPSRRHLVARPTAPSPTRPAVRPASCQAR